MVVVVVVVGMVVVVVEANYGYSPSPNQPNVFMAVVMDQPDFESPIWAVRILLLVVVVMMTWQPAEATDPTLSSPTSSWLRP